MKAFIVDDEKPAREELRWLLEQCDDVAVVGEAGEASGARDAFASQEVAEDVDVVFLDIDMPGIDGIRLAESLQTIESPPVTVFVTAYDDFAVDAFGVDAVDYLLKPVRLQRLRKSVERARRRLAARARDGSTELEAGGGQDDEDESTPLERISVEDNGSYRVVDVEEILFFESIDGDVFVRTPEARYKTDFRLKFLESNLPQDHFYRCHRSFIVRLDAIRSIEPAGAGTYRLHLGGDGPVDEADVVDADSRAETSADSKPAAMHVPLARARASEFKRRIPWSANVVD